MPKRSTLKATSTQQQRPTLVLSPSAWLSRLEQELVAVGIGHDESALLARRVLQGLVNRYLKGTTIEPEPEPDYYA